MYAVEVGWIVQHHTATVQ